MNSLQEAVTKLANGLAETRERQTTQDERLKSLTEYMEKSSQGSSPASSQPAKPTPQQRKLSLQRATRRPSNISRLTLEDPAHRRFSAADVGGAELETFLEGRDDGMTLRTPAQTSPPVSQGSSQGSNPNVQSPATAQNSQLGGPMFSTPTTINTPRAMSTPSGQFTPNSSYNRIQHQSTATSPPLRRQKSTSIIMTSLPSPNMTPTPSYNYPGSYPLQPLESPQYVPQQSDLQLQPAQPPATYQQAAAPYATPPRLSQGYVGSFMGDMGSTFGGYLPVQQPQQQRRRRQNSDVNEDMDLV